jgi:hypothetical protein
MVGYVIFTLFPSLITLGPSAERLCQQHVNARILNLVFFSINLWCFIDKDVRFFCMRISLLLRLLFSNGFMDLPNICYNGLHQHHRSRVVFLIGFLLLEGPISKICCKQLKIKTQNETYKSFKTKIRKI